MATRIYILEDHPIVQETLCAMINAIPELTVCGAACTAPEALAQLAQVAADIVLVDISLPGMDGLTFIRAVQQQYPALRCLIVSTHDDPTHVRQALAAGAHGYAVKHSFGDITKAISHVLNGEIYLSPNLRSGY